MARSQPEDVASILTSKLAKRYEGKDTAAMQAVAKAHENRSLADFEKALRDYKGGASSSPAVLLSSCRADIVVCAELGDDPIVRNHLSALYDTLLEQNLVRVIEPYSRVELAYVASEVKLPLRDVEAKLSQMILDKVFTGILDQGAGCLEVYEDEGDEQLYDSTLSTLKQIGSVVDSLYAKATTIV